MTHDEALEQLADHPLLWRLKQLVADDNSDAEQREGYRVAVVRLARGESDPGSPPAVTVSYGDPPPSGGGCCGG